MNWLDIIFAVIVVASALIGLRQGLIKEVTHFGGAVAGLIIAIRTHEQFSDLLVDWLGEGALLRVVSFFAVFAIVYIAAVVVGWLLSGSLKTLKLRWIDRLLGVVFGTLRGTLIVLLLLVAILLTVQPERPARPLRSSAVYGVLSPGVRIIARWMPGRLGRKLEHWHDVQRQSEPKPLRQGTPI